MERRTMERKKIYFEIFGRSFSVYLFEDHFRNNLDQKSRILFSIERFFFHETDKTECLFIFSKKIALLFEEIVSMHPVNIPCSQSFRPTFARSHDDQKKRKFVHAGQRSRRKWSGNTGCLGEQKTFDRFRLSNRSIVTPVFPNLLFVDDCLSLFLCLLV